MALARRLAPDARVLPPDPAAAGALEAAIAALGTISPLVVAPVHPADPAFGRIELGLDGLELLWGPEPVLVARVGETLGPILPGPPRAGIAGTRFAAMVAAALAEPGRDGRLHARIVPPGGDAAFLAPLSVTLLSDSADLRDRLARYGLRRIGEVAALPSSALVARFGPEGSRMRDRAAGRETDPLRPERAAERLHLGLPIEPPIETAEPLRFLLHRLTGALAGALGARGLAARHVTLRLTLERTPDRATLPAELIIEQRLPAPIADGAAIERLLLAQLERTPPPAPVERIELALAELTAETGTQLALFEPPGARPGLAAELLALALRFPGRIGHVELVDPAATLAERRSRWRPIEHGDEQ